MAYSLSKMEEYFPPDTLVADSCLVVKLREQPEATMKSTLTGCEEAPRPGFPGPGGSGEGPSLLHWPMFRGPGAWGHYSVNTCSSLSFMVSGEPQVKFGSHKAIFPQIASCFPGSPDGYYIRSCFRVRIFTFVHCLGMILSNTSFIYTFACF